MGRRYGLKFKEFCGSMGIEAIENDACMLKQIQSMAILLQHWKKIWRI